MDHFVIEDLLNFPNDDNLDGGLTDSSTATPVNTSCNSSYFQGGPGGVGDGHFTNELCVPYDDLAELEWVSSFVDESFSSDDLHLLEVEGMKARNNEVPQTHQYEFQPESSRSGPMLSVPGKARSKRSRAAPGSWTSRVLMVQEVAGEGEGRRCLHCATDKTPQWRTGPMGPKTLCNACGVRYKSGRLVPEYRPAASPTFVLMKHSNSHRKVLELRRQKEMQQQFLHQHHQQQQSIMFDVSKSNDDDYLIHQHIQPGFRHLIQD